MNAWVYSLVSVVLVSLVSLIGIMTLSWRKETLQRILPFLVSFAVGALLGDAFIHILPESFEKMGINLMTSSYVLLGILGFFVLEKFVRWRHCHIPTSSDHPHPIVFMNLVGDGLHNLIDGMIIGASFAVSTTVGLATTAAVILHEIPQEIGDFGVLIHGGLSVQKALFYNFLSGLLAVVGAVISLILGAQMENYTLAMLCVTAGGFLYIAGSDLIPELHHHVNIKTSLGQLGGILLGIGMMALLMLVGEG